MRMGIVSYGIGTEEAGGTVVMKSAIGHAGPDVIGEFEEKSMSAAQTKRMPYDRNNHIASTNAAHHVIEACHNQGRQNVTDAGDLTTGTEKDRHPESGRPSRPRSGPKGTTETVAAISRTPLWTADIDDSNHDLLRQEQPIIPTPWKLL